MKMYNINFSKEAARANINHALYYFIKNFHRLKRHTFFYDFNKRTYTHTKRAHKNHPYKKITHENCKANEKFTTNNTKKKTKQKKCMLKLC